MGRGPGKEKRPCAAPFTVSAGTYPLRFDSHIAEAAFDGAGPTMADWGDVNEASVAVS